MEKIQFQLNQHLKSIIELTREQASDFIHSWDSPAIKYFDAPISGIVNITYPLKKPTTFKVNNIETVGELLYDIALEYERIYKEEAKSTKNPILDVEERGIVINRNETNGTYEIYGHDIEDLYFEGISIDENNIIALALGS